MAKTDFELFKEAFETLMLMDYGIGIDDCTDEEELRQEFEAGATAQGFVDYLGEKRDLIKQERYKPFYS